MKELVQCLVFCYKAEQFSVFDAITSASIDQTNLPTQSPMSVAVASSRNISNQEHEERLLVVTLQPKIFEACLGCATAGTFLDAEVSNLTD